MEFLTQLWLPIVLSAVAVFFASSIIWMALPLHKNDYRALPDEDSLRAEMRRRKIAPGQYMFPYCDPKGDKEAAKRKWAEGPVGVMILRPGGEFNMGATLGKWIIYCLIVSCFVAYVAWHALHGQPSPDYLTVFRVVATTAMLAYVAAIVPTGIWKGVPWGVVFREVIDGVIYGLLTAGFFAWLWPRAVGL